MSKAYETHKRTPAGRARTLERRAIRYVKYGTSADKRNSNGGTR